MPLVRIDLVQGRTPEQVRRLADVVQEVMREVFAAPERDRYQVITQHPAGEMIVEDTGLGYERTDALTLIHVFQQGRDTEQKQALYAELSARLEADCGVPTTDLVVSISANDKPDWSFGEGRAQFLDGGL